MAVLSHVCSCISHSTLFTSTAPSSSLSVSPTTFLQLSSFSTESTWNNIRRTNLCSNVNSLRYSGKTLLRHRHKYYNPCSSMASSLDESGKRSKRVWIWTSNKQVMTAAVERGWNTFVIPAENIIAAFQRSQNTVFAISNNTSEAQVFLEALEHGLDGIIMKVEDVEPVLELKEYFDRRMEESNLLSLTKATVTHIQAAGMGDRVCVDLCSLMRPGEGLLVGSFARGLFLVHSECLESNYIASRPFRVNAGPVHAYVAVPGGRTCYLSELKSGKEVIIVDHQGRQRIAIVGRVKIESRPLILVEAKIESDNQSISILLQNAETVALVCTPQGNTLLKTSIPVTSLKVGDEILLRVQGGARHTGIEIQEFIVEK
ncbi:3-dehydroquinate synthase [Glycine max]|nr:3-dehydroquinate synthase [Glycine max]